MTARDDRPRHARWLMKGCGLLAVTAAALLVSGCASIAAGTTSIQRAGESIALVAPVPPSAVMEALLNGELARDDAGCLALDTGSERHVLQFPFGTSLHEDGEGVDVPELGEVRLGDAIQGGGGFTSLDRHSGDCAADNYAIWQTVIG